VSPVWLGPCCSAFVGPTADSPFCRWCGSAVSELVSASNALVMLPSCARSISIAFLFVILDDFNFEIISYFARLGIRSGMICTRVATFFFSCGVSDCWIDNEAIGSVSPNGYSKSIVTSQNRVYADV
jgi:hypothetical protein